MHRRVSLPIIACSMALAACAAVSTPRTVSETIASRPELSTFTKLVGDAGLNSTLDLAGPHTVFAPTNEAFQAMKPEALATLASNRHLLKSVLAYHVVPASLPAADIGNRSVKSSQGADLALSKSGTYVTVEDAVVVQADVAVANGVVHEIDRVLMPPTR